MTKFLHDQPERDSIWRQDDILDEDIEKREFDRNFTDSDVYNSILDDQPVYHSLMNFPEEEEDSLYADNNIFDDRDAYKNAGQDDIYYFI